MDDSAIMRDKLLEETVPTNLNENKANCKMQNFHILLIAIALMIAVSSYCYLIKCREKQKYLLSFHFTNNKLKEIMY